MSIYIIKMRENEPIMMREVIVSLPSAAAAADAKTAETSVCDVTVDGRDAGD